MSGSRISDMTRATALGDDADIPVIIGGLNYKFDLSDYLGLVAAPDGVYVLDAVQTALTARGYVLRDETVLNNGVSVATAQAAVLAMEQRFRRTDAGGRYFTLARSGSVEALRLDADTDTTLIQAALDLDSLWRMDPFTVESGSYTIIDSLFVTRGLLNAPGPVNRFAQGVLQGRGRGFVNEVEYSGTRLVFTATDRPAVIHQGGRHNEVRDLTITGPLEDYLVDRGYCVIGTAPPADDTLEASWLNGLPNGRYNVLAGIAVDPYSAFPVATPADPYPEPVNPIWAGVDTYYGRALTWGQHQERINIYGFVVGLAVHPCPDDRQGDLTRLRDFEIASCAYAVSVGNDQSRNVEIRNGVIRIVFCAITNVKHGPQDGTLGGPIENITAFQLIKYFDLRLSTSGPVTFRNCYGESIWLMGELHNGASTSQPLVWDGGHLYFDHNTEDRGNPYAVLRNPDDKQGGYASGIVEIRNCMIQADWFLGFDVAQLRVEGTRIWIASITDAGTGDYPALTAARAMAHNGTAGGIDSPTFQASFPHKVGFNPVNLDTLAASTTQAWTNDSFRNTNRTYCIPWFMEKAVPRLSTSLRDAVTMPRRDGFSVLKSGLSAISVLESTVLFTNGAAEADARQRGMTKGRLVKDSISGARFYISEYAGGSGSCEMIALTGWYKDDVDNPHLRETFDTVNGYLYFLETGFYTPSYPLLGDVTAGSAVITNLRSPSGTAAGATLASWLTGDIVANDYLWIDPADPLPPFIGANARVASMDVGAATLTMAGNAVASSTQVGRRFELFMRMIA